jgi:hypothetical protein
VEELDTVSLTNSLAINAVIYSELSIAFERIEELESVLSEASRSVEPIPREALFLAGKAAGGPCNRALMINPPRELT